MEKQYHVDSNEHNTENKQTSTYRTTGSKQYYAFQNEINVASRHASVMDSVAGPDSSNDCPVLRQIAISNEMHGKVFDIFE